MLLEAKGSHSFFPGLRCTAVHYPDPDLLTERHGSPYHPSRKVQAGPDAWSAADALWLLLCPNPVCTLAFH